MNAALRTYRRVRESSRLWQVNKTRFDELGYTQADRGLWRFVDLTNPKADGLPSCVGPSYPTERALLADLQRYAEFFGCNS
jgi:hypothetical protein